MKIDISKVRVTPNNIEEHCAVYQITDEVLKWIDYHNLKTTKHEKGYLNIYIDSLEYRWQDLFSVDNSFIYFGCLLFVVSGLLFHYFVTK